MEDKGIWTMAELEGGRIKEVSYELLARGQRLAEKRESPLSSILIGREISKEQIQELIFRGAKKVYTVFHSDLEHFIVETYSNILYQLIKQYSPEIILAAASTQGRTLMPHVAVRIPTGLTADCTDLQIEEETGNLLQIRPAIGGNIMATIKTPQERPQMATIRPRSTPLPPVDKGRRGEIIPIRYDAKWTDNRVKRISFRREEEEVDLQDAPIIISVGRGLKKKENIPLIRALAKALKGKIASSREAVDRGFISYPHQVGLSGKTVNPKLYLAVGISGAVQHLAGMKTSEIIIAINKDPQAFIFKVADFGLVGDLFNIIPAFLEELKKEEAQWSTREYIGE